MDESEMVRRLLDQNDRLIEALVRSSPVEIVRALNPPIPPPPAAPDFWRGDAEPPGPDVLDAWGDDRIASEVLLGGRGGWVTPGIVDEVPVDEVEG